ncbi:CPBP family glutamic-type intramembrane protease [Psychroserpens ponticola]|uniref:CPBP family glutamic-type intramembrane protease n=1 Tax=Psychroserpens ponticola TaxID=2932268 RepID=A0ABY7S1T1_9FLAO|nr:CPBP family glutamic-type intramembrane protease [Psychroserpens ponticola]WCO03341.1 CPBP family glutamic-type intramembrane protease [Psychroserpens ponticola]
MFITQAFKVKHDFWRYIIGSLMVLIASIIGQFPLLIAMVWKSLQDGGIGVENITEESMYTMFDSNVFLFLMLLSFAAGFVGLFLAVKYLHKQTMTSIATSRPKLDWKRIWFAFIFWGTLSSGLVLLDYFYLAPENYMYNFELKRFAILVVIAVALIPIQTSLEEYIFRGYLMQGFGTVTKHQHFPFAFIVSTVLIPLIVILNVNYTIDALLNLALIFGAFIFVLLVFQVLKKINFFESKTNDSLRNVCQRNWTPILITSVIFGGLHLANPEVGKLGYFIMIYYIGTGLFWGIMTVMDEGMELALGFHAANNLFTALLVTTDWTAMQTHSILKDIAEPELGMIDLVVPVFIMYPVLLFIFSKKYKWTNWKDKLFGKIEEPPKEDYKIIE